MPSSRSGRINQRRTRLRFLSASKEQCHAGARLVLGRTTALLNCLVAHHTDLLTADLASASGANAADSPGEWLTFASSPMIEALSPNNTRRGRERVPAIAKPASSVTILVQRWFTCCFGDLCLSVPAAHKLLLGPIELLSPRVKQRILSMRHRALETRVGGADFFNLTVQWTCIANAAYGPDRHEKSRAPWPQP
jgi:hypothetical protein